MNSHETPVDVDTAEATITEFDQPQFQARLGSIASEGQVSLDDEAELASEAEQSAPEKPPKLTAQQQAELDAKIRVGLGGRQGPRLPKISDQPRRPRRRRR